MFESAQAIKVAQMKGDSLMGKDLKMKVLEVVGTCTSMGVTIEGMEPKVARTEILAGKFDVLAGLLQEKYGYTRQHAVEEIDKHVTAYEAGLKKSTPTPVK